MPYGKIGKRKYAGAKTTAGTGDWNPANNTQNEEIASSESVLRGRIRQLVRDVPIMWNIQNKLVDYSVGNGMQFQYKAKSPGGKPRTKLNKEIEKRWKMYSMGRNCDAGGRLSLREIARLACRQYNESGEFLGLKVVERGHEFPFKLRMIESDWLSQPYANDLGTEIVEMGVQYVKNTYKIVKYHFQDQLNFLQTVTVNADDVLHGFETLRPGQVRGVSPMACLVLIVDCMNQYLQSELTAAQMIAKIVGFIESTDLNNYFGRNGNELQEDTDIPESDRYSKYQDIDEATLLTLEPGEKVSFNTQGKQNQEFADFLDVVTRFISVATGLSHHIVSADSKGLNFSNMKAMKNDMMKTMRVKQRNMIEWFYNPVFEYFMDGEVLSGKVPVDPVKYFKDKTEYLEPARFIPPGEDFTDPGREVRAIIEQLENKMTSLQRYYADQGLDWEEELESIAESEAKMKELGLEYAGAVEKLPTNPSKELDEEE